MRTIGNPMTSAGEIVTHKPEAQARDDGFSRLRFGLVGGLLSCRKNSCILALLFCWPTPSAHADGGTVRLAEKCGPYRLTVFTQPTPWRAGPVDVSVLVQNAANGEPVPDARVTVRIAPQGRPGLLSSHAATQENATNKLLYAAVFDLPEAGTWRVTVVIDGPAGAAEGAFDLEAAGPPPVGGDMFFWIVWPIIPIVLFTWHEVRRSRPHS